MIITIIIAVLITLGIAMRGRGAGYGRIGSVSAVFGLLMGIIFFLVGAILGTIGLTAVTDSFITGILTAFTGSFVGAILLGFSLFLMTIIWFFVGAILTDFIVWLDSITQ